MCSSYSVFFAFILLTFFPLLNEDAEILPVGFNVYASTFSHLRRTRVRTCQGHELSGRVIADCTPGYSGLSPTVHQVITPEFLPPIASSAEGFLSVRICLIFSLFVQRAPDNKYAAAGAAM